MDHSIYNISEPKRDFLKFYQLPMMLFIHPSFSKKTFISPFFSFLLQNNFTSATYVLGRDNLSLFCKGQFFLRLRNNFFYLHTYFPLAKSRHALHINYFFSRKYAVSILISEIFLKNASFFFQNYEVINYFCFQETKIIFKNVITRQSLFVNIWLFSREKEPIAFFSGRISKIHSTHFVHKNVNMRV